MSSPPIYTPTVGGPIQNNALAIVLAMLQGEWECSNPTAQNIPTWVVADRRTPFNGLAVVVSRVSKVDLGARMAMPYYFWDNVYCTAFSLSELQKDNMIDEIRRIILANQNAWCGGIQQMLKIDSVLRDDLSLTPAVLAEAVLVRLTYQDVLNVS